MTTVKKVKILGEDWKVIITNDKIKYSGLQEVSGYCDHTSKICVIDNKLENDYFQPQNPKEYIKRAVRHELIHAFLFEAGLAYDSLSCRGSWAMNEEMIDWFARQITKIENVALEIDLVIDKMT